jgi:hypothetical protein
MPFYPWLIVFIERTQVTFFERTLVTRIVLTESMGRSPLNDQEHGRDHEKGQRHS